MRPPVGFHFKVEILLPGSSDEIDVRFQEAAGLSSETGTEEVNEGGENRFSHRLPTRVKYGNLVLKRGLVTESKLVNWCKNAMENFMFQPADVLVTLLNEEHQPLMGWNFIKARPVKWTVSDLKAQENAVVVETLELAYQYFRRV